MFTLFKVGGPIRGSGAWVCGGGGGGKGFDISRVPRMPITVRISGSIYFRIPDLITGLNLSFFK